MNETLFQQVALTAAYASTSEISIDESQCMQSQIMHKYEEGKGLSLLKFVQNYVQ